MERLGDIDLYVDFYRRLRLIRGLEDLVQSRFLRGEIYGTTHLYEGPQVAGERSTNTDIQQGRWSWLDSS